MSFPKRSNSGSEARKEQVSELQGLLKGYAKQELLAVPMQGLAFAVLGATVVAIGMFQLMLGVLRLVQSEPGTVFDGRWSFVPYLITTLVIGLFTALMMKRSMNKAKLAKAEKIVRKSKKS